MLITAVVGLVCNLISIFTLNCLNVGNDQVNANNSEKSKEETEGFKHSHCHTPVLLSSKKQLKRKALSEDD
jgi:hypothetical protein